MTEPASHPASQPASQPALQQEAERIRAGVLSVIAAAVVLVSAGLIATAWWLVIPPLPAERPVAEPSPLEHGLFDRATGGDDARAAAAHRLDGYGWVDRGAGLVRIPIERAIDAVVADPRLIGAPPPPAPVVTGEVGR